MIEARIGGIHPHYVDVHDAEPEQHLAGFDFDLVVAASDLTYEEALDKASRGDRFHLVDGSVWVLYSFTESSCRILEGVYPSRDRAVEHGEPGMHVGRVNFGDGPELGRGVEIFDWEEL